MVGTIMIDDTGDLMLGEYDGGVQSVAVATKAVAAAQSMSMAISTSKGSVWWNLSKGIDRDLFEGSTLQDDRANPIRATVISEAIRSIDGFKSFSGGEGITFTRQGRTLKPNIPCILLDCDHELDQAYINQMRA